MFFSWSLELMKTLMLWSELQDSPKPLSLPLTSWQGALHFCSATLLHRCYCRKRNKKDNKYGLKTQRRDEGSNKPQTKYSKGSGGKAAVESLTKVCGCRATHSNTDSNTPADFNLTEHFSKAIIEEKWKKTAKPSTFFISHDLLWTDT